MKKVFSILMLIPIFLYGQNEKDTKNNLSQNNVYLETHLGGISQLLLNYERPVSSDFFAKSKFFNSEKVIWLRRIGLGYGANLTDGFSGSAGFGGLLAITMLTGKKNKHFEVNAGAFLGIEKLHYYFLLPILNIGYRYQKPGSGFVFRANAGFPAIGVSVGYAF